MLVDRASWLARLALGIAVLVIVAAAPPIRGALVAVEPVIGPGLFWIGLVGGLAASSLRRHRARRFLRRTAARVLRLGGVHGWWLAPVVFLIPLWSQWAAQPTSSVSAHAALLEVLPWGDATGHYEGGIRLLDAGEYTAFSARRPLHACWLAVRLALGRGSVELALALQAVLLGFAAWLLSRAVAARHGAWPALAVFGFVYAFAREYTAAVLTEPLGITLGCLAAASFLVSLSRLSLVPLALSFLALETALRARPGAQFLLLFVALWAIVATAGRRVRVAGALVVVLIFGAAFTSALNRLYSSGEASFASYPAMTLYGLAFGANYEKAEEDVVEADSQASEIERTGPLVRRALQHIAAHPRVFLGSLWRNERKFFTKTPVTVVRLVSPRWFVQRADDRVRATSADLRHDKLWGAWPLVVAGLGALVFLWPRPRAEKLLWLAVAAGLVASVPFIYSDTGFRALAPAYPFIALFFSLGCAPRPPRSLPRTGDTFDRHLVNVCAAITVAVLVVALAGPPVARLSWPADAPAIAARTDPTLGIIEPARSPLVVVRNPLEVESFGRLRVLDRPDFLRLVRFADLKGELQPLTQRRPPFVVLSAYDYANRRVRTLVAPVELARSAARYIRVNARLLPGSEAIEAVEGWEPIPE